MRAFLLAAALALGMAGSGGLGAQELPDLVTPDILRVCADPADLPFSNRRGEGFENKIAAILAADLKVPLRFYWLEQGPGFILNTLGQRLCDVIIGYPAGSDLVGHTSPYYRSAYMLVARRGEFPGITGLDDPRLRGKRIGMVAGTPPGDHLAAHDLVSQAVPYSPYSLGREPGGPTPAAAMVADLASGAIDVALLWGPSAGWLARQSKADLDLVPLLHEAARPPLSFRIGLAIRANEPAWRRTLNAVLQRRGREITDVLSRYDVPLLDETDRIVPAGAGAAPAPPASR
jgi:mxaJ protein